MLGENVRDKTSATYMAVAVSVVGVNTPPLEKRSIMIRIAVYPLDSGSCSMKYILIKCHGCSGMGRVVECCKIGGEQACFVHRECIVR